MYACELVFDDPDDAARLVATVEESTGQPCPCKRGEPCPLVPTNFRLTPRRLRGLGVGGVAARAAALIAAACAGGFLRVIFDSGSSIPLS